MADPTVRTVRIPVTIVQELANYLAQRPFREVASFMAYFGQLSPDDVATPAPPSASPNPTTNGAATPRKPVAAAKD